MKILNLLNHFGLNISNSLWEENIILSPDSIFLSNYSKMDSCVITNNSNQVVYLDSIYNKFYSSYYCTLKKDTEFYFGIDHYENNDSLHIRLNPTDTATFIILGVDVCPICKKQSEGYLVDTLVFVFSSESNQTTEKFLLLNSDIPLDAEDENTNISTFYLSQNYPNPFNPDTKINYSAPNISFVTIKVYDVLGNEIATLINEEKKSGNYQVEFNGSNLSSGVYFYRMQAGNFSNTKKLILIK